jgi:hypothetical protein
MNSNKINKQYNISKNNLKQTFKLKNINTSSSMDLSSLKFKNNLKSNNILPLTKRNKENNVLNFFNYNSNNTSLKGNNNDIYKETNKDNLNIFLSEKNFKIYLKDDNKKFFSRGNINKEINLSPLQTKFNNFNINNEKKILFHSNVLSQENSPKNSIDNLLKNRINKNKYTKKIYINSEKLSEIKHNNKLNFINNINIDCPEEEHFLQVKINQKLNTFHKNF